MFRLFLSISTRTKELKLDELTTQIHVLCKPVNKKSFTDVPVFLLQAIRGLKNRPSPGRYSLPQIYRSTGIDFCALRFKGFIHVFRQKIAPATLIKFPLKGAETGIFYVNPVFFTESFWYLTL